MRESDEGWGARTRTHSPTASRHRDSVLTESTSLYVKRIGLSNSPLAISSSPLHKPLSTTMRKSFVQGSRRGSPALFVSAFMWRYISASKLRWRKYGDRGEPADRYRHKGRRTVRGRFMGDAAGAQSITPAVFTTPLWWRHARPPARWRISHQVSRGRAADGRKRACFWRVSQNAVLLRWSAATSWWKWFNNCLMDWDEILYRHSGSTGN